jgi:hypothetical protein
LEGKAHAEKSPASQSCVRTRNPINI